MATIAGVLNDCLEKKGQYALNKAGAPLCYKIIHIEHDIAQLYGAPSFRSVSRTSPLRGPEWWPLEMV
jgi:hypothetical protein